MEIYLDDNQVRIVQAALAAAGTPEARKIARRLQEKAEDEKLGTKTTIGGWRLKTEVHGEIVRCTLHPDDYDRQEEGIEFEVDDLDDLAACLAAARAEIEKHRQRCEAKAAGEQP